MACACTRVAPPANAHPSHDALARAVLAAVARRDAGALRALALDEQEFRTHVWPELPAARPERNLPFSYVWGELRQKSEQMLGATIAAHGGRSYELVRVDYPSGATPYDTYVVHRETTLVVRTPEGTEARLQLYGSTLQKNGAFKVFSYVVDD